MHLRRRRARGAWRVLLAWCLVAAAASVTVVRPATAAPEPPLVVETGDTSGEVRIEPPTQQVDGTRVVWQLHNGGAGTLTFALAIHEVEASTEGAAIGAVLTDLAPAVDRLTLAPGEQGRVPVHLSDTTPRALALVATTVDAEPETTVSGLALVGVGGPVTPEVVTADSGAGTVTVRLDADGPALVDVAVRATVWPGRPTTTHRLEGVLVPAGGRDVPVRLAGPVVGRVALDVAVTTGDEVGRDSRSVWWWPRSTLVLVAVTLLVVTFGVIALVRRRRG